MKQIKVELHCFKRLYSLYSFLPSKDRLSVQFRGKLLREIFSSSLFRNVLNLRNWHFTQLYCFSIRHSCIPNKCKGESRHLKLRILEILNWFTSVHFGFPQCFFLAKHAGPTGTMLQIEKTEVSTGILAGSWIPHS